MDQRLRALERRARAGDPRADALLLRERLRLGELTEDGLRLAAFLGHQAAAGALGQEEPDPPEEELFAWLRELESWGQRVRVRMVLAVADLAHEGFVERFGEGELPPDPRFAHAREAAEAWLRAPGEATRVDAQLAAQDLERAEEEALEHSDEWPLLAWVLKHVALCAAELPLEAPRLGRHPTMAVTALTYLLADEDQAETAALAARVRTRIRAALLAWALGTEPLAARHEAAEDVSPDRQGRL